MSNKFKPFKYLGLYVISVIFLMGVTNLAARLLYPEGSSGDISGILFLFWILANFLLAIPVALLINTLLRKWGGRGKTK